MSNDRKLSWGIYWMGIAFILICIVLALQGCGEDLGPICEPADVEEIEAAVVGGVPSTDRRSTVQVLGSGRCSGTIVGPHTVLTAAHCSGLDVIEVSPEARFGVVRALEHPEARKPGRHDIALLFTADALPEPYATLDHPVECSAFILQGYGLDQPGQLYEREVFETDRGDGLVYFSEGSCRGDSGGPVYAITDEGPVQVAVVSFGPESCEYRSGGYVDLTQDGNIGWIEANLE